jgi:surface polysaccharide O-acyltransferase-like enzyme
LKNISETSRDSELKSPPRLFWADFIRGLSIVLVIMIHVSSPVMNQWGDASLDDWLAANIYNTIARVSVPLLFMVSGYLLLERQESIVDFYRKRVQKVVFPLLIWSVIYLVWQQDYTGYTPINFLKSIFYWILTGPVQYHLWFLYQLLAIYLFVPVLRIFVRSADKKHLWYFAALWLIFGPVLSWVQEDILDFKLALDLGFFTGYFGYFLGQVRSTRAWTWALVIIYITGGWITYRETYLLTIDMGRLDQFYINYLRIYVALMSISAFLLLKSWGEQIAARAGTLILALGRHFAEASFGIYLVHVLVLFYLKRGIYLPEISGLAGPTAWMVPLTTFAALLVSWVIVVILQRIPGVRSIVPR